MKIKRIEIEGPAGHAAIGREGDTIRIDSIVRNPTGEQAWVSAEFAVDDLRDTANGRERGRAWAAIALAQARCDGVPGTPSEVDEYFTEFARIAGL